MFDLKWLLALIKDSDTLFVAGVVSLTCLVIHWVSGYPASLPWWVVPTFLLLLLTSVVSLALKAFGYWFLSR